jgi:hypothetical protein
LAGTPCNLDSFAGLCRGTTVRSFNALANAITLGCQPAPRNNVFEVLVRLAGPAGLQVTARDPAGGENLFTYVGPITADNAGVTCPASVVTIEVALEEFPAGGTATPVVLQGGSCAGVVLQPGSSFTCVLSALPDANLTRVLLITSRP